MEIASCFVALWKFVKKKYTLKALHEDFWSYFNN